MRAQPEAWIAQELVPLSTVPTAGHDGMLAPRHVDLRPFAVFGERIDIVPGGLTRVALNEGSMIVNSSRGGGSKDTWVLEDGEDVADRAGPPIADTAPPALPDLRYGTWTSQQQQQQQQERVRCSPASPTSCTGSAATLRAPSSPRARSTASSAPSCRARPRPAPACASAGTGCSRCSAGTARRERQRRRGGAPLRREQALERLTLDADRPDSMLACVERSREGARTVRDVICAEMWEAINTTTLTLRRDAAASWRLPGGAYQASQYVKQRTALIWGIAERAMLRDEAKRFLDAGGLIEVADMVLRMLRVALPPGDEAHADGNAFALLQAVGGFHAYLPRGDRAAERAAGRALPAVRARVPGQRCGVRRLAARGVRRGGRLAGRLEAGAARQPPRRRPRVSAARAAGRRRAARHLRARAAASSARVDQDVADRYFAGAEAASAAAMAGDGEEGNPFSPTTEPPCTSRSDTSPNTAIASPVTDNLNALRVRPATTSTQRCDEFHARIDPEARVSRHLDYFGTEVLEFGIPTGHDPLTIDVRARVVTSDPPTPPTGGWEALAAPPTARRPASSCCRGKTSRRSPGSTTCMPRWRRRAARRRRVSLLCELIPDTFAYRPGTTYVGSTIADLLEAGAGVCQDFVHLALVLLRRRGIAARYVSGYLWAAPTDGGADSMEVDTHAWLEALLPGTGGRGEPAWVGADPTNRILANETHVKIGHGRYYADVPPVKGVYRGSQTSTLEAAVTMSRLDPAAGARA